MSRSSRTRLLTDEQWNRLVPHLPTNTGKVGRSFADHRRVVEGIIYRYRTGIPWRDLPREAFGPWQTVWKRHRKWAADGTWDRVLTHLTPYADTHDQIEWTVSVDSTITRAHQHATNTTRPASESRPLAGETAGTSEPEPAADGIGRSRGGLTTKMHHIVDGHGRPLAVAISEGQIHDGQVLPLLLDDIRVPRLGPGRPRTTPAALLGDKAYSSKRIRADLAARGIRAVIPERADQRANRK